VISAAATPPDVMVHAPAHCCECDGLPATGSAVRCEAGLRPAVTDKEFVGLSPSFGLWPMSGAARTGGGAQIIIQVERRGGASPHIGRRSRGGHPQCRDGPV